MARVLVSGIVKRFGAIRAVSGASLAFDAGEIHAVVGENGAGKSTLLRVTAGILEPEAGEVVVDGERLRPHSAAEAIRRGIGMVEQHFALVGVMTALENVVLGVEPTRGFGRLDLVSARRKIEGVARDLGMTLAFDVPVETLGIGDRQRLEIARALYRDARVLILDEPTSVLTPGEVGALYAVLRRLATTGRAVVVVTHKLDEVRAYADRVSVMRRGEVVSTRALASEAGQRDEDVRVIADQIMGGRAPEPAPKHRRAAGEPVLEARGLTMGRALQGVDLEVRAGEIVGIAGVEGNGQRELVTLLAARDEPRAAVAHEDRHRDGLVLDASVRENAVLGGLGAFTRLGVVDASAVDREARALVDEGGVVPPELDRLARELSGGNQQKIVILRAVRRTRGEAARPLLVVAHPTRGVDLGAARAIHREILEAAARGVGVVVVSADLDELRALSDTILVLSRGRVAARFPPTASDAEIGAAMLGA